MRPSECRKNKKPNRNKDNREIMLITIKISLVKFVWEIKIKMIILSFLHADVEEVANFYI